MKIILTIDDSPSTKFIEKIETLKRYNIPAILFCRGDNMTQQLDDIVFAIKQNFIIGNHAFDHPRFSKRALDECLDQIQRTEVLINQAYALAGAERPFKLFRFPFGDRGQDENKLKIQAFLIENKFQSIASILSEPVRNFDNSSDDGVDSLWSFDVLEYKTIYKKDRSKFGLYNTKDVVTRLEEYVQSKKTSAGTEVVLLHDFEKTHYMFSDLIKTLVESKFTFLDLNSPVTNGLLDSVSTVKLLFSESVVSKNTSHRERSPAFR